MKQHGTLTQTLQMLQSVSAVTIEKLFDNKNYYSIPDYQRDYSWELSQVIQLMNDITQAMVDQKPW